MNIHSQISVVIPTNRDKNHTITSIPNECEVIIRRDKGLNVARNRGIEEVSNEWIVLLDDDTEYPTKLITELFPSMKSHHLIGLEDYEDELRWVIGRFMMFHKSQWKAVGGFDETVNHGGDTDFAVRCEKNGATIIPIPRSYLPHYDDKSSFTKTDYLKWLGYQVRRNPLKMSLPAVKLIINELLKRKDSIKF